MPVLLEGPREVGKTSICQQFLGVSRNRYFNWDDPENRAKILSESWPDEPGILVLDEIHKFKPWKSLLSELQIQRKRGFNLMAAGSAAHYDSFETSAKESDFKLRRLHPLSVAELQISSEKDLEYLLEQSGFPEPYFMGEGEFKSKWSAHYRDKLVREDLAGHSQLTNLGQIEQLALILPELIGEPLSLNALRSKLKVSHATVSNWCNLLEKFFYIFRIYPFSSPKVKAIKKSAKHYQYDWSLVKEPAKRLENLAASHLLKWCHFLEDSEGRRVELRYFRDIDLREVDFVLVEQGAPLAFIELAMSARTMKKGYKSLRYLKKKFPDVRAMVLAADCLKPSIDDYGVESLNLIEYLGTLA